MRDLLFLADERQAGDQAAGRARVQCGVDGRQKGEIHGQGQPRIQVARDPRATGTGKCTPSLLGGRGELRTSWSRWDGSQAGRRRSGIRPGRPLKSVLRFAETILTAHTPPGTLEEYRDYVRQTREAN